MSSHLSLPPSLLGEGGGLWFCFRGGASFSEPGSGPLVRHGSQGSPPDVWR